MNEYRHVASILITAVPLVCAADDAVVYLHIADSRTSFDQAVGEHFAKRYRVVEVSDKDHAWIGPRGINPSPTPPAYRDGECVAGQSLVAFVIALDGTVGDAFAFRSTDQFIGTTAVSVAKGKRFAPAQMDGRPVSSLAATNFRFVCPGPKK